MIERLHYITQGDIPGYTHAHLAEIACQNGVQWVQLRIKGESFESYLKQAYAAKIICQKYNAKLIINDNVSVAKEVEADGVHLGKDDMDPKKARDLLGENFLIGATSNTLEDILALTKKKVDYVGLGPFRFTTTKKNLSSLLGLEGYQTIMNSLQSKGVYIPVIAIGGILPHDIGNLLETGVHGVALASVINGADDKPAVIRQVLKELKYGEVANSR